MFNKKNELCCFKGIVSSIYIVRNKESVPFARVRLACAKHYCDEHGCFVNDTILETVLFFDHDVNHLEKNNVQKGVYLSLVGVRQTRTYSDSKKNQRQEQFIKVLKWKLGYQAISINQQEEVFS